MLFDYLKYINPVWYFNIHSECQTVSYFLDYSKLTTDEQNMIEIDQGYQTDQGRIGDAAYQAWQKGILKFDTGDSIFSSGVISAPFYHKTMELFKGCSIRFSDKPIVTDLNDNYRFIRRFFNPGICWYIFLIRLLSLHNPLKEIPAFTKSLTAKKVDLFRKNSFELYSDKYNSFNSELIRSNPKVSVIIPTLNRYPYLKDVLSDLEKQIFKNFEVIICDQSEPIDETFYTGWQLEIKLIQQKEKALWHARNRSIREASGEFILLFDDDSRVEPDWIIQHLKCLDYFAADISSGVSLSASGAKVPQNYAYFRWGDQIDTGNVMFRKKIMNTTGMFDRQFEGQRQGDGEFGLRCYLLGFRNISNPLAARVHLKVTIGGLRQMGSWDGFRPKKIFAPRPVPSVLFLSRKYFGNHLSSLMLLFSIPDSIVPYRFKANKSLKVIARVILLLLWPVVVSQVIISWQKAGIKLNEGAKIESL
jgi:glycosyltransferase involved in cell wall biosynthesis